jgi:hypothetical protein
MKITNTIVTIAALFTVVVSGCGGSSMSAPPVSLPTPVTGRIAISSSDADGNITVTGEDGSVTGSSTVLAINGSVVVTSLPYRLLDLLVKDAYASVDSFPSVCSLLGRACALADENGAFELTIAASDGDEIIVVIIDATTGEELSERLTKTVPTDIVPFGGSPVGVKLGPSVADLFILLHGDSDEVNRLQYASLSPWSVGTDTMDVGGTSAVQLAASQNYVAVSDVPSEGSATSFFISDIDPVTDLPAAFSEVALVNNVGTGPDYILPSDMMFLTASIQGTYREFLTFSNGAAAPSAYFYRLDNQVFKGFTIDVSEFGQGVTHLETAAFDMELALIPDPLGSDVPLEIFAFASRFQQTDGSASTVLTVFQSWAIADWLGTGMSEPYADDAITLPAGAIVEDLSIVYNANNIVVTDSGNNAIYIYSLSMSNSIVQIDSDPLVITSSDDIIGPKKIKVVYDVGGHAIVLFVALNNGNDARLDTMITLVPDTNTIGPDTTFQQKLTPVGITPTDIAFDAVGEYVYVSCYLSKNVARLPLSEVLPSE